MRKLRYVFLAVAMIIATGVFAAPTSLLPDHFGAWQATGPSTITTGKDLNAWFKVDPRREVSREAGLTGIEARTYRDGDKEINLNLSIFKDPTGAYQEFTLATSTEHHAYKLGR